MSVAQWVLFGLATWLVVAVALGLLVARVLRSAGEQDEPQHRPDPEQTLPVDELDGSGPDDTVSTDRDRDHDEVARARKRRRRAG